MDALCDYQLDNLSDLDLTHSLSSDADTNAELILTLGHCHTLKVLDLSLNNLHVPGGRALGKVISQLSLQILNVSNANLGDEGMAALAKSLHGTCYIGMLHLENNDIHVTGVTVLADKQNLIIETDLCLDGNPLCLDGVKALIRMLSSEHFQTPFLDLRGCSLTIVGGSVIPTVSTSPNISEPITCVGIREWIYSNGIKANNVVLLNLSGNSFTGNGIHLLAGFVYLCPQLKVLNCDGCEINSDDLKQLLLLFSRLNLNLEDWRLWDNNIDDDGVSALIERVSIFPSLMNINICYNNHISSGILLKLQEICDRRKEVNSIIPLFKIFYH